ncbi:MAG: TonB-dependent receptor [Verrucomicrobia bacterium]|jgi:vitamin B12 transporter|nr:TonB-dependent receptor [Verrucomicrobiota bacterium]
MKRSQILLQVFLGCVVAASAETQLVEKVDMVVRAEAVRSGRVVGQDASVAVTLAGTPGVSVTSQGIPGGQTDLSIRGSSFSGAGISLNGLSLQNAQTEHFNAELPIIAGVLSTPEILTGVDQVLVTEGHLVGTASFSIMPIDTGRSLTFGIAEDEGYWLSTLIQESRPFANGAGISGFGVFGAHTQANSVDSQDNDVRSSRGGGQFQIATDESQWDVVVAHQQKAFGARGYYGVTPTWDAEEETEDTLVVGSWLRGDLHGSYLRASVMWREQSDDYTLYWTLPGVYNNAHRTVTQSAVLAGRELLGDSFLLDWRASGQSERIRSSALGDHDRTRGGLTLVPGMQLGRWSLKAGARHEVFEDDDSETLPQGAVEYTRSERLRLRLSHSQSVRQPSYTELNYESPASLGNSGLENQTAETTELLATGEFPGKVEWRMGIFQRVTRDAVDWIRETEASTRWTASNLDRIETEGVEVGVSRRAVGGSRVAAHYTFLRKSSDVDFYSSRYAMDYPEHHFLLSGLWQFCPCMGVELTQVVRQQEDNPLRESSDTGYDGALALHWVPCSSPRTQVSLMVSNLWDDDYNDFPGQEVVSQRRVSAGLTVEW